uniref:Uncharacterized protein n=1 Tax=Arundo donax TaxID=35708 RepID=A0A0A9FE35_ARUDO
MVDKMLRSDLLHMQYESHLNSIRPVCIQLPAVKVVKIRMQCHHFFMLHAAVITYNICSLCLFDSFLSDRIKLVLPDPL